MPILLASLLEVLYCPGLAEVEIWTDLHWHQVLPASSLHLCTSLLVVLRRLRELLFDLERTQFSRLTVTPL